MVRIRGDPDKWLAKDIPHSRRGSLKKRVKRFLIDAVMVAPLLSWVLPIPKRDLTLEASCVWLFLR